jgi:hypothetical protein
MASTLKKVVVRRFDRESLSGFVNPLSYLQSHEIEVLRPEGSVARVPYSELKDVCFVRDFDAEPETSRVFNTRPKLEGLWARMMFRDGEVRDGILANNLLSWDIHGFTVIPPEPDSNNQRVFVPRAALRSMQVLGVVGSPLRPRKKKGEVEGQSKLF